MAKLILSPNLEDADGFYEALLNVHEGLEDEETQALNARLVLVLANHIGKKEILADAIAASERALKSR
ncbi:MAG: DUF2783 domain-containing protein [Cognatishimia activa]